METPEEKIYQEWRFFRRQAFGARLNALEAYESYKFGEVSDDFSKSLTMYHQMCRRANEFLSSKDVKGGIKLIPVPIPLPKPSDVSKIPAGAEYA